MSRSFAVAPVLALALLAPTGARSEGGLPILRSNAAVITVQDGDEPEPVPNWTLAPEVRPDRFEARLIDGKPHKVTFTSDLDSISFLVEEGKSYDFIVRHGDDLCYTRIVGVRFTPAAVFDETYRQLHQGRISVEVPEVYELVNVALAMTPTGIADGNLIYQKSDYYPRVRSWFDDHRDHPLLVALDARLKESPDSYFSLKMNGYAFAFDANGQIVQSPVYDRTGFAGETSNTLRPFLDELRSFAEKTRFREFFRANRTTYAQQVDFYRDVADLAGMRRWLDGRFPQSSDYGTIKVIFSPLVAYNQSATWLESNGFRELQAHVNFPYEQDLARSLGEAELSPSAEIVFRGNIVFTEINHGYINPEAEKYAPAILAATSRRELWVDPAKGAGYYAGLATFNEYMNWGLVSLRFVDLVAPGEQETLIAAVEAMMTKRRGFPKFAEFNRFLVDLYRNRPAGTTVAALYPRIIEWFASRNTPPAPASPAPTS